MRFSIPESGTTEMAPDRDASADIPPPPSRGLRLLSLLWNDKFAFAGAMFVLLVVLFAVFGPLLLGDVATKINLRGRNMPPFSLDKGLLFVLGADALGRSILARIVVAGQNTMAIAATAVFAAMILGGTLGLMAGFVGGWFGNIVMRLADIIMGFPSLLIAMIVLYILEPRVYNLVIVLGITRMPIYMRTARAEVLEIRERLFVQAAQVMGASRRRIIGRHIAPLVLPTLTTIAALDFAFVMLVESALSFLGIGIQPPDITWGLMVAQGKNYLQVAWWLSFFPGLAIMLTALSLNLLSSWVRIALDPVQRWRLETPRRGGGG